MIIKKIAFGNTQRAFIEDGLTSGFNVIYSDDNQKGKTVLIQSMMYALGNDPIFPEGFDKESQNYYYYILIQHDSKEYEILRKGSNFVVRANGQLEYLSSVSDFKYYIDTNIMSLPRIIKNSREKVVDLFLFFQLFFIGQDKRDTSKIALSGYYNKEDFVEMLFALQGISKLLPSVDSSTLKEAILRLKEAKETLVSKTAIISKLNQTASVILSSVDKETLKGKLDNADKLNSVIIDIKKERTRLYNNLINTRNLKNELQSLNRTMETGALKCLNCGSHNVGYDSADGEISFELTNLDIRKSILDSIDKKICTLEDEIDRLDTELLGKQEKYKEIVKDDDVSFENVLLYKKELISDFDSDKKIIEIDYKIKELANQLTANTKSNDDILEKRKNLKIELIKSISDIYKTIDPETELTFSDLFTKSSTTYSGSESNIFFLSRILSYVKCFKHSLPLIVDSFRSDELSSKKEDVVLSLFKEVNNQKIFTATLKMQELNKYNDVDFINRLDYSKVRSSHILDEKYSESFKLILISFGVNLKE